MNRAQIIIKLKELEEDWNEDYYLYANGSVIQLVEIATLRVVDFFYIPNDGGDVGIRYDNLGREILDY